MLGQIDDLKRDNARLRGQVAAGTVGADARSSTSDAALTAQVASLQSENAVLLSRLSSAENVLQQTQTLMEQDTGTGEQTDMSALLDQVPMLPGRAADSDDDHDSVVIHTPAESVNGDLADLERENASLRAQIGDVQKEVKGALTESAAELTTLQTSNDDLRAQVQALAEQESALRHCVREIKLAVGIHEGAATAAEAADAVAQAYSDQRDQLMEARTSSARLEAQLGEAQAALENLRQGSDGEAQETAALREALSSLQNTVRDGEERLRQQMPRVLQLVGNASASASAALRKSVMV